MCNKTFVVFLLLRLALSIVFGSDNDYNNNNNSEEYNSSCHLDNETPTCHSHVIETRKRYYTGDWICSPNQRFRFGLTRTTTRTKNSNHPKLCLCRSNYDHHHQVLQGSPVWCTDLAAVSHYPDDTDTETHTDVHTQLYFVMHEGGNLVVYEEDNHNKNNETQTMGTGENLTSPHPRRKAVWSSQTCHLGGSTFVVSNNGTGYIENQNHQVIWSVPEPPHQPQLPTPPPTIAVVSPPLLSTQSSSDWSDNKFELEYDDKLETNESELVLYVTADTPYNVNDIKILRRQIANLPNDAEALLHLGDIMAGGGHRWDRSKYTQVRDVLSQSHVPWFLLPGDNDANDAPQFDTAWTYWKDTFMSFQPTTTTSSQPFQTMVRRHEQDSANFAFVEKGVLVVGVDVTSGKPHDRDEWRLRFSVNLQFIEQQIQQHYDYNNDDDYNNNHNNDRAHAIVIVGHGRPRPSNRYFFRNLYRRLTQRWKVPLDKVLYVHGDGHRPETHYYKKKLLCVQVDRGNHQWLKLRVKGRRRVENNENDNISDIPFVYSHVKIH